MDGLVIWVTSLMKERLCSTAWAVSSYQIVDVCLRLPGHFFTASPHHVHTNVLFLINETDLATHPGIFQITVKGHAGGCCLESTCHPLTLCSHRGAAGGRLVFALSLWCLDLACWGLSGGSNVPFCLCPAVSENDRRTLKGTPTMFQHNT